MREDCRPPTTMANVYESRQSGSTSLSDVMPWQQQRKIVADQAQLSPCDSICLDNVLDPEQLRVMRPTVKRRESRDFR